MTNQHNTPHSPNGQLHAHKNQIIKDWVAASETAIEALFAFKAYLYAWDKHPASVPADMFQSVLQDLDEAGLAEWAAVSWADIEALKKVVTK